jgi:2-methylcitrate dehydratase PrpD
VLALAARVECRPDPDSLFPRCFSAGVEVETRSGACFRHHEAVNRGAGDRALSNAEIVEKFHANAAPALGEARAEAMAAHVLDMERYTGRELMRGLVPAAPGCGL